MINLAFLLGILLVFGVIILFLINLIGPDMKDTDVNCVSISKDKNLIASADNLGRPKVFIYPAFLPR